MQLTFEYWNRTNSPNDALTHFIFLHGMGGTGKLWRPIAASLESEFGIWAPDQRGHGGSRPVTDDDYSVESFGKDVCDFMEAQKLKPEDCFLVGHSMGVRTTASAAAQLPLRIRGIVLIDLGFSGPAGGGLGEVLSSFLSKLPTRFESRAAARDFMEAEAPDPSMGQYLMATGRPTSDGAFEFPFDPESLIATQKNAMTSDIRPLLLDQAKSGVPILALRGETSRVWSEQDYEAEKQTFAEFPNVALETFEGTGHGLPFEKRKEFAERLREFNRSLAH